MVWCVKERNIRGWQYNTNAPLFSWICHFIVKNLDFFFSEFYTPLYALPLIFSYF